MQRLVLISMLLTLSSAMASATAPPSDAVTILTTIEQLADVRSMSAVALTRDGLPVIAYYDEAIRTVKVARCDTLACTSPTIIPVATELRESFLDLSLALSSSDAPVVTFSGSSPLQVAICDDSDCGSPVIRGIDGTETLRSSLALSASDFPIVSYISNRSKLRIAFCSDAQCDSPKVKQDVDDSVRFGPTSLTLDSSGLAAIAYRAPAEGSTSLGAYVARCNDASCSSPDLIAVDSNEDAGILPSLRLDPFDNIVLAQVVQTGDAIGDLVLTVCNDFDCTVRTRTILDQAARIRGVTSLAISSRGLPVVSYISAPENDLRLAICKNPTCTDFNLATVDSSGTGKGDPSLVLKADVPIISHSQGDAIKMAVCTICRPPVTQSLDRDGNVGQFSSLALDADGIPLVSYYDANNFDLKLVTCKDATCSNRVTRILDDEPLTMGFYTAIALTEAGAPVVTYWDVSNLDLRMAVCNDRDCESPSFTAVDDTSSNQGTYSSVVLNSSGIPVVSYHDEANQDLRIATCNSPACDSPPTRRTVDGATSRVGRFTSLALGNDGFPVISYYDETNRDLKLAVCEDTTCASASPQRIDGSDAVGEYTSLALNSRGFPVISYYDETNGRLMIAVCNNRECSQPAVGLVVDEEADVGKYSSLALTADDFPVIAYYDATNFNLKLAVCTDITCTRPTLIAIDSKGFVGEHLSLALTSAGFPVISYYDGAGKADLKLSLVRGVPLVTDGFESGNTSSW